jgi:hypothetical protein
MDKEPGGTKMAGKRKKSIKSISRKKNPATRPKKKHRSAVSHHAYEAKIQGALSGTLSDVQLILGKLDENDANTAPTDGISKRINALIGETTNGKPVPADHEHRIEGILYAVAGIDHQYDIGGATPSTQVKKPSDTDSHETKVLELFTTINSICREVFSILESATTLPVRKPPTRDNTTDIVNMALDTQMVVHKIWIHINQIHAASK